MAQRLVAKKLLIEDLQTKTDILFKQLKAAKSFVGFKRVMKLYEKEMALFGSNYSRVGFLFYANTLDAKNNELYQYWNSIYSKYSSIDDVYRQILLSSPFLKDIKKEKGESYYFSLTHTKNLPEKAQALSKKEQELVMQYQQLTASARYEWDGKQISDGEIIKYQESIHRNERKKSADLQYDFLAKNDAQITATFLELVKIRKEKAKESGYADYPEMMKVEYKRIGYDYADLSKFCGMVKTHFKPLYSEIKKLQKQKLHIEKCAYYDTVFFDKEIKRDKAKTSAALLKNAGEMYAEMDKDMAKLFSHIINGNHFEYKDKKGKVFAGFANYDYISNEPFIFSLFNGSTFDIKVVTHEFGHAFQMNQSVNKKTINYSGSTPTLDTVEIFSMAMELFTHGGIYRFYGKDAPLYVVDNFLEMTVTIISCCIWHELQYFIYNTPALTGKKINDQFLKLLRAYYGEQNFEDNRYLLAGNGWKRMSHLFFAPFYIIDYSFGALGAFQLKMLYEKDTKHALKMYKEMCNHANLLNMKNLEKLSPIKSPFKESTIKNVAKYCQKLIENYAQL